MNTLSTEKRVQVVKCLVEGNSVRATVRITGVAKNTILKLLVDLGKACAEYQNEHHVNLPCKRLECDEIWSFCYAKAKNIPESKALDPGVGDIWTWTAICADTKLVPCWAVGSRSGWMANRFMKDLARRLTDRVQLTTDGHNVYLEAVLGAFGSEIDYAMLVKLYGPSGNDQKPETRYSPGKCNGSKRQPVIGNPDQSKVSTSYAERLNLTIRMHNRRFTRLTNAFSKKFENLSHSVALHFMHYNYCRVHQTIETTPAQAAGLTDHKWTVNELVGLLDSN